MEELTNPIIYKTKYSNDALITMDKEIEKNFGEDSKYISEYPTLYIINNNEKKNKYSVYIGETNDIKQRTSQHLREDPKYREDWKKLSKQDNAMMYVIGHDHFNKSLTLDIENRMMLYLSSVESVETLYNRRTNEQKEYYTSEEMENIFSKIWNHLKNENDELFPSEQTVKDSAIFKASPFHKLSKEQIDGKNQIMAKITESLTNSNKNHQLIIVEGAAGTGKTVLISSIFFELFQYKYNTIEEDLPIYDDLSAYLIVNHDEQLKVYEEIANKLNITEKEGKEVVKKPTTFINNIDEGAAIDVVLIDEAHLLWTQGKQSYRGKNQLDDILNRAKVVVAIVDYNQVLSRESLIEERDYYKQLHDANLKNNYILLENQMRINASDETNDWLANFSRENILGNIPKDDKGYDVKVFDSPKSMHQAIKNKSVLYDKGISRLVATYDWPYNNSKSPEDEEYWNVTIGDWKKPWNYQLIEAKEEKMLNKQRAWAEQSHTINEVGSTFTIQGFDLNYVGVIIGPSVKYRNGQIVFDKNESKNKKAIQKRTLADGSKQEFSDMLLKNELNVLLTRGVNGLYLYAVDKELQQALKKAEKGEL